MISINDEKFHEKFVLKDATVGQIGHGYIGNAVAELFKGFCTVLIYDKFKTTQESGAKYQTLDEVVARSQVIFVAVPTPMKPSGECHTEFVESVLQDIQNTAVKIDRDVSEFIVVIKSTVSPGFTKKMQEKYALRILFSPEFLTEANSVNDFKKVNRVILGGEKEDALVVYKFFEGVWADRIWDVYSDHEDGPVTIANCDSTTAELVKLASNAHLMSRVLLSNELYLICQAMNVKYDDVRVLTSLDPRIGVSHMAVPGPDGHLGAGGHCFIKDINSLKFEAEKLKTGEKIFSVLLSRNLEIREDRDWEQMDGRAVIADKEI